MVVPCIHRRRFLALCALGAAGLAVPRRGRTAAAAPLALRAVIRTLDIGGRAATVFGLEGPGGRPGLVLAPGQPFAVRLENRLTEPTLVHWHGQIPPNVQDGVPDAPLPALLPGESREYDFTPRAGTYWMHAHFPLQEMQLFAALRDTVRVPPATTMTIAFDAGEAANWMFHCHHMPHLLTGMMTELAVSR